MAKFEPDRPDFTSYGLSCVQWNPSPMRRPDHHNEIQLNMLVRGRVTYLIGAHRVKISAGHLTAFWAAIPHQIVDYEPDTEYYVATLPLAWFLQCELPDGLVKPLMRGEVVSEPDAARADFDSALFRQWMGDLKPGDKNVREIVFLEMKTRLRRLALVQTMPRDGVTRAKGVKVQVSGLNKVEQMICYIAQSYTDPISVTDIGREAGLHPNSAMRLFKRTFGTTLIEHLTHHRVFHAKRLLATTDKKIVDIAFGSGFNSISRFNEAFRRATGYTPRAYRQEHERDDDQ